MSYSGIVPEGTKLPTTPAPLSKLQIIGVAAILIILAGLVWTYSTPRSQATTPQQQALFRIADNLCGRMSNAQGFDFQMEYETVTKSARAGFSPQQLDRMTTNVCPVTFRNYIEKSYVPPQ